MKTKVSVLTTAGLVVMATLFFAFLRTESCPVKGTSRYRGEQAIQLPACCMKKQLFSPVQ